MCEGRKVNLKTGNPVVDAVGKMNYAGNVIPENWFKTIVTASGKVHLLAIFILSEIVYCLRNIETKLGKCPNVLYLELNPEALYRLTFTCADDESADNAGVNGKSVKNETPDQEDPDDKGVDKKGNTSSTESAGHGSNTADFAVYQQDEDITSLPDDDDVLTNKETCPALTVPTNTKNTTKNSTSFSTTALAREVVVTEAMGIFAPIELDEEDVRAIVKASGYDIKKCREAKAVYDVQREPIKNAMGWLKSAVMKGYKIIPRIPPAKNSFNNFENQIYDAETIDALEAELLGANYIS